MEIIFIVQKYFIKNRAGRMAPQVKGLVTQTWQPELVLRSPQQEKIHPESCPLTYT